VRHRLVARGQVNRGRDGQQIRCRGACYGYGVQQCSVVFRKFGKVGCGGAMPSTSNRVPIEPKAEIYLIAGGGSCQFGRSGIHRDSMHEWPAALKEFTVEVRR